jgi:hypothetical protein
MAFMRLSFGHGSRGRPSCEIRRPWIGGSEAPKSKDAVILVCAVTVNAALTAALRWVVLSFDHRIIGSGDPLIGGGKDEVCQSLG